MDTTTLDFDAWLREADRACLARYGLSLHDLPDACWSDYHADGMTPDEALTAAKEWFGCL